MPTDGWFKTYRSLFRHPVFSGDEFCRGHAFSDLIGMAEFESGWKGVKGHLVKLERGELFASVRFLGERWRWSNGKVQRFLARLEAEEMVFEVRSETVPDRGTPLGTVYRIANYDTYQAIPEDLRNGQRNSNGTATGQIEERKELTTSSTTTGGASEIETAKREMWEDFNRLCEGLSGFDRIKAEALVRGVIEGDATKAWEAPDGSRVPWPERPRLLRLALDEAKASRAKVANALRYTVIPRELDAYKQASSADKKPKPGSEAAAVRSEMPRQNHSASTSGLSQIGAKPPPPDRPTVNIEDAMVTRWAEENPVPNRRLRESIAARITRGEAPVKNEKAIRAWADSEYRRIVLEHIRKASAA